MRLTSFIIPELKKRDSSTLKEYRLVAFTSHVMKIFKRLVLKHLRTLLTAFQNLLQFAYQPHIGEEDTIIFQIRRALSHLRGREAV